MRRPYVDDFYELSLGHLRSAYAEPTTLVDFDMTITKFRLCEDGALCVVRNDNILIRVLESVMIVQNVRVTLPIPFRHDPLVSND